MKKKECQLLVHLVHFLEFSFTGNDDTSKFNLDPTFNSFKNWLSFCVYVHICVHVCMHVYIAREHTDVQSSSVTLHLTCWGKVSHWTQSSAIHLVFSSSLLWRPLSPPPECWDYSKPPCSVSTWVLTIQTWSPHFFPSAVSHLPSAILFKTKQ